MMIQTVFCKISMGAVVAGALLALGSASSAMAQEQAMGRAMVDPPNGAMSPTASLGALGSAPLTTMTGPRLADLPSAPQLQAQTQYQGQAPTGGQGSSPDAGSSPPATTMTAAGASPTVDAGATPADPPPPPPLTTPVVPPLEHKSGGLPIWLVLLVALAALWLGRKVSRARR